MPTFKLRTRFTLILSLIFLTAFIASWVIFSQVLQQQAEAEIRYRGLALMTMLSSVRSYTSDHINPLLADDLGTSAEFISETVPAFSARTVFERFRNQAEFSDFLYKEAGFNPTNPNDRATPFEETLLTVFRDDPTQMELSGFTTLDGQQVFYNARPLAVTSESCLACHSTPENAPASLINTYGSEHGFGWQLGEVVAARTLYLPAQAVFDQAQQSMRLVMGIIVAIFVIVVLVTNFILRRMVVRPVIQIARVAQLISNDALTPNATELETVSTIAQRQDELGDTARIVQKMADEIYTRVQNLKKEIQSLLIQVDAEKQAKQVQEITDNDFFRNLQQRAQTIRQRESNNRKPIPAGSDEQTTP